MEEQLRIPMPVIGAQVTVRLEAGRHWVVEGRCLRQDQGWQSIGRYRVAERRAAELMAWELLGEVWDAPPLD